MNAAILAACATNIIKNNQVKTIHTTGTGELYYKVILKKYYHFEPMTLVAKINYPWFLDKHNGALAVKTIKVESKTLSVAHAFSIAASKCPNGVDSYIKENLTRFSNSAIWQVYDKQVINKYHTELMDKYDIDVEPSSFIFTSEYYWEVV